jgi:hypothetical protein
VSSLHPPEGGDQTKRKSGPGILDIPLFGSFFMVKREGFLFSEGKEI